MLCEKMSVHSGKTYPAKDPLLHSGKTYTPKIITYNYPKK